MKIYGLTGGIASGKSEATKRFQELGIPVIDADKVAHEVIEPGGTAEQGVMEAFGPEILTHGRIDRQKLGPIVFRDPDALQQLNQLVHPAVRMEIARRTAGLAEENHSTVIIDAALHAENGHMPPGFEALIVVDCPVEERVRRLMEHRGMSEDEARRRIAAQTPPEKKIPLARWVIDNSGTIENLREQVDAIAREL